LTRQAVYARPSLLDRADCRLDAASIKMSCDASLRRLQTPYVDLFQLHWPDRYCPGFGANVYDPKKEHETIPIKESVAALGELIAAGKIRWGLMYGARHVTGCQ